jgi:hypothetical protein
MAAAAAGGFALLWIKVPSPSPYKSHSVRGDDKVGGGDGTNLSIRMEIGKMAT